MNEKFGWIDYFFFLLMLLISTGMGIYHGIYKKQQTAADYLLGGKQMAIVPISMSLISSTLSGLALLSFPADIYRHGISLILTSPMHIVVIAIAYYIYIPVFYELEVTSIYEYFKIRYNNKIRVFASIVYIIHMLLLMPIFIYVPALAFSQVSDVSVHYITPVVCSVCIFYTTLGGIKAAVWSDALQFIIMFGSLVLVVIVGTINSGGVSNVLQKFSAGQRMDMSFELSITRRDTFWAVAVGSSFAALNHMGLNQGFVQKCLSLSNFRSIRLTLVLATIGITVITFLSGFSGLVIFAHYYGCDPLQMKAIRTYDQLLPMYVVEVASFIPGLPGLFISGIFSASLSALSASLNCMAGIIHKDLISGFLPKDTSEITVSRHLKLLVVILGIICTILVFLVEKLGSLLPLTLSVAAVSGGPLFGLFTAGMLIPTVHTTGALWGGISSVIVTSVIIIGAQVHRYRGTFRYIPLPVSTDACNTTITGFLNETTSVIANSLNADIDKPEQPFFLFRISFFYYIMIGGSIAIIVSVIVSHFTERDKPLNKKCLSPIIRSLIDDDELTKYYTVEKATELLSKP